MILDGKFKERTDIIDTYNRGFYTHYELMRTIKSPKNIYYPMLFTYAFPTFSVVLIRADKLKACDFSPILINGLDIYLWKQLRLTCKVGFIDESLAFWRRSGESFIHEKQDIKRLPEFIKIIDGIGGRLQSIKDKLYKFFVKVIRIAYRKKIINNTLKIRVFGITIKKYSLDFNDFL